VLPYCHCVFRDASSEEPFLLPQNIVSQRSDAVPVVFIPIVFEASFD